jgi:hypothetical protein
MFDEQVFDLLTNVCSSNVRSLELLERMFVERMFAG